MSHNKARLTFTPKALPFILKAFGKSINDNDIIIDDESGEPILSPEGEQISRHNFGGIKKGSLIFLKKDLLTAIKLTEDKY